MKRGFTYQRLVIFFAFDFIFYQKYLATAGFLVTTFVTTFF